jgi:hypothetical protein
MIAKENYAATEALAIVQKYEDFIKYVYPILQTCPRKHGVFRDVVLTALFEPIGHLYHAARSKQVSRLHAVDAEFATMRSHLRFLVHIHAINSHRHGAALTLLAESGRMLGAWQRKLGGQTGK